MTFETQELSLQSGSPFYLYQFNTDTTAYRYINFPADYEFNGETWKGSSIKHTEVRRGADKKGITVTGPFGDEFFDSFKSYSRDSRLSLDIYRGQFRQAETALSFKGRYMSHEFVEGGVKLTIEHASTSAKRIGAHLKYEKLCRHHIYSPHGCRLDPDDWGMEVTIESVGLGSKTFSTGDMEENFSDIFHSGLGHYGGGYVKFSDGSKRGITRYLSNLNPNSGSFSLAAEKLEMEVGQKVTIYPGCDGTVGRCKYFGNLDNQGGLAWAPTENPFDSPVI